MHVGAQIMDGNDVLRPRAVGVTASRRRGATPRRDTAATVGGGFTLIEMIVAVSLLVIIIVAVGQIFKGAGQGIGLSQASSEVITNVRSMQTQMETDFAGLDRSGFIVIRSRLNGTNRWDQIAFLASGTFPNRNGTSSGAFSDLTTANAARIWYGQVQATADVASTVTQATPVAIAAVPTGVNDQDFILGRHAMLLLAGTGATTISTTISGNTYTINTYSSIARSAAGTLGTGTNTLALTGETDAADITAARVCAANITSAQVMSAILAKDTSTSSLIAPYLADQYCYRVNVLPNPWSSTEATGVVNAYFRMTPIMLQGLPSFAVDWTDGSSTSGQLNWYGLAGVKGDASIEVAGASLVGSDGYEAIFTATNRAKWPKAIRLTYRVVDSRNVLQGGRMFVHILKVPD